MFLADKKGSFTVMAVLCFSALLIAVGAAILCTGDAAVGSCVNSLGRLWGTSLLGEYDLNLKDRYGIFAFYGNESLAEKKLDGYADYSFKDKDYINYGGSKADLNGYCLGDTAVFKEQIHQAVSFGAAPVPIVRSEGSEEGGENYGSRRITSQWVLAGLPSAGSGDRLRLSEITDAVKAGKGLETLIGNSLTNVYIFKYFKNNADENNLGESFFKNEVEYILSGKPSDEEALKHVKTMIKTIRNGLNLVYLYSCPEKREAAAAMAAALTAGAKATVTQAVILETWAYGEAVNDVNLLLAGKKVPLMKTDESWALTLENALASDSVFKDGYIKPEKEEGCTYEEYLRIMMNFMSEETRLLRAMDIIQINMKYMYCDYFLIEDYYVGVEFKLRVNEKEYSFKETYKR